jgi:FMN phosphatase YigB (HAD superfamily)
MINTLITDVSKVLLFPSDETYDGSLNALYKENSEDPGFNFFAHFKLNIELLDFYKSLTNRLEIHILTSDVIQDAPELQQYWSETITQIFSASKMGTHKSEPLAYEKVIQELKIKANTALYVDDSVGNIEAAKQVGLNTIIHTNNAQTIAEINNLL